VILQLEKVPTFDVVNSRVLTGKFRQYTYFNPDRIVFLGGSNPKKRSVMKRTIAFNRRSLVLLKISFTAVPVLVTDISSAEVRC